MTALDELRGVIRAVVLEVLAEQKPATSGGMITIAAYAKMWSLSVSTVRRAIRDGRLPATKVGRGIRVAADSAIGRRVAVVETSIAARKERVLAIVRGGK